MVELHLACLIMLWYNVLFFKTQVLDGWTTLGMWLHNIMFYFYWIVELLLACEVMLWYNVLFLKLKFWMVELHLACEVMLWTIICFVFKTKVLDGWTTFGIWLHDIMFCFYWIVELHLACEVMLWYNVLFLKFKLSSFQEKQVHMNICT